MLPYKSNGYHGTLIANPSAKKSNPTSSRTTVQEDDEFSKAYKDLLKKYGRTESEMSDWMDNLKEHIDTLQNIVDISEDKIATKDNKIVDLIMTVKQLNDSISDLENQKSALEAEAVQHTLLRRKLHNEIQELKGCAPFFIYTLTHSHIYAYLLL